jgi:hypothetical protein
MSEEKSAARLFVFDEQKDFGKTYKPLLWPTSADKALMNSQGVDEPVVNLQQIYFVNDLDVSPSAKTEMQRFIQTCQQYNFNTIKHDTKKSQEDWFHALFFNFDLCQMTIDLENAIQFILRKYEPLKEIPNSEMQWSFIKKVFAMAVKHKDPTIKIFLILALVTWEKELADQIITLCTTTKTKNNFSFCLPHLKALTDGCVHSPYTRTNINYVIEFFLVQACKLCQMNIIPGIDMLVDQMAHQEKINQMEADQASFNVNEAAENNNLFDLNV